MSDEVDASADEDASDSDTVKTLFWAEEQDRLWGDAAESGTADSSPQREYAPAAYDPALDG
ncbi:MAG: hypothetical protein KC912_17610 [Proteobacteria bacterium]|nr:hypothetical protein [Pseudomonadota bacterium]